jgi:hypothetical protein
LFPLETRASGFRIFSTPTFTAEVPDSWTMKLSEKTCYQFSAPGKTQSEDYSLEICAVEKGLDNAAYDSGIFDKDDKGNWITIAGQGGSKTAEVVLNHDGWQGIQAKIDCGIEDPQSGFHAAAGDCYWAVTSNGKRSLIIDTQGLYRDFDTVSRVVKSLRIK